MKRLIFIMLSMLLLTSCSIGSEPELKESDSNVVENNDIEVDVEERDEVDSSENKSNYSERIDYYVIDDPDTGYDWVLTIPESIDIDKKNVIALSLESSNLENEHYTYDMDERKESFGADWLVDSCGYIGLNIIMVEDDEHGNALQLDHMFTTSNPFYERSDKKIATIIDKALEQIKEQGITVNEKVVVEGFSGEGVFAHKFAVLWPEKVLAVVGGQCGGYLTMLDPPYNGVEMEWPYGLKGYEENTGREFNKKAFNEIIKYIYVGNLDNICTYFMETETNEYTKIEDVVFKELGDTDPIRLYNLVEYFKEQGYENYYFKMFNNLYHSSPKEYIKEVMLLIKEEQENIDLSQFISSKEEIEVMTSDEVKDKIQHNPDDIRYKN